MLSFRGREKFSTVTQSGDRISERRPMILSGELLRESADGVSDDDRVGTGLKRGRMGEVTKWLEGGSGQERSSGLVGDSGLWWIMCEPLESESQRGETGKGGNWGLAAGGGPPSRLRGERTGLMREA